MGNWDRVRNADRNDYHLRMLCNLHPSDQWIRRAVARNLSVDDAINLESTLILCYGRKNLGTGTLVNKNNGIGTIDLRIISTPASAPEAFGFFPTLVVVGLCVASVLVILSSVGAPTVRQKLSSIPQLNVGTRIQGGCRPGERTIEGVVTAVGRTGEDDYSIQWAGFQSEIRYKGRSAGGKFRYRRI
jgi:hypothetical protein